MNKDKEIELLIQEFGGYRELITDAIHWLEQREPEWKLKEPIDKRKFIQNLIDNIAKD